MSAAISRSKGRHAVHSILYSFSGEPVEIKDAFAEKFKQLDSMELIQ